MTEPTNNIKTLHLYPDFDREDSLVFFQTDPYFASSPARVRLPEKIADTLGRTPSLSAPVRLNLLVRTYRRGVPCSQGLFLKGLGHLDGATEPLRLFDFEGHSVFFSRDEGLQGIGHVGSPDGEMRQYDVVYGTCLDGEPAHALCIPLHPSLDLDKSSFESEVSLCRDLVAFVDDTRRLRLFSDDPLYIPRPLDKEVALPDLLKERNLLPSALNTLELIFELSDSIPQTEPADEQLQALVPVATGHDASGRLVLITDIPEPAAVLDRPSWAGTVFDEDFARTRTSFSMPGGKSLTFRKEDRLCSYTLVKK